LSDGSERRITMTQNLDDPVVGGFVPSVDGPMTYRVATADWQSDSYTVDVFEFPALVRSDASLKFPEYTGMEEKRVEDTLRVSAVEGTEVTWVCFLNKAVEAAELVAKDGTRLKLTEDPAWPGAVSVRLDLRETQRWKLELLDDAGRKNKYPPELVARVLPNQPPQLKLTVAGDTSVSPLEEFPLGAEVRDDFGVAKVGLSYTFASQGPQDVLLGEQLARGAKAEVQHLIEFEQLQAEPDQLLAYHFWAEDFGPDGQLRRTESDMFFAEVRPFEEIFREGEQPPGGAPSQQPPGQSRNGQEAEQLAELQKEIINATWRVIRDERGNTRSAKFAENVDLLQESQGDALAQLEELATKVRDPQSLQHIDAVRQQMQQAITLLSQAGDESDVNPLPTALTAEQSAYALLLKLRAREFQVTRSQQSSRSQSQSASQQRRQQQLDELELKQDENRYETQQQAEEQTEQDAQQQEMRQVLNRLRELAQRQEDLNKELAQLQSALEQAETEEEKQEIERQLKRLRDQQQELLRETDELNERMQQPENRDQMSEAGERLEQTRENVRQASEALEQNDAAQALTAGRRAQREFEELRDEFRQQAAGQFNESVRQMREQAQKLDQQQEQLSEQLADLNDTKASPGVRGENDRDQIRKELETQRQQLGGLLERMQQTVEEAETAEPLLAQKLYDSYRSTQQQQVDSQLRDSAELLRRGFDPQARELEQRAAQGIDQLRQELEEAASTVLGDETKALQRALGELEQLEQALEEELNNNRPQDSESAGPQESQQSQQSREGQSGRGQSEGGQQPSPARGEGQPQDGSQQPGGRDTRQGGLSRFAAENPAAAPLTGDGFREWSDRLRDVEEMVGDPQLRSEAARIRDRARDVRMDFRRHSKEPQWELVDQLIATPLRELKRNVSAELLRRSAEKHAPVPIDRDPVPAPFADAVRQYYESLGSGR
jgi:hypothetical protein